MVELLIPIGRRVPVAYTAGVPAALKGRVAGVFGRGGAPLPEIGHAFGGRAAKPIKPILVYGPYGQVLTMIVGAGETEAAELEELAHAALERQRATAADEWRERHRLPDRDRVDAMTRQALRDRAEDRRAHPSKYRGMPGPLRHDPAMIAALPRIPEE